MNSYLICYCHSSGAGHSVFRMPFLTPKTIQQVTKEIENTCGFQIALTNIIKLDPSDA